MKSLGFLYHLLVVNCVYCQDRDEVFNSNIRTIMQKLDHITEKLKGFEELQQNQREILNHLNGFNQNGGQSFGGTGLGNVLAGQKEIKSFVHKEINDIIALSERDECSDGSHNCGSEATCGNTFFSFSCTCAPGFNWNGHACEDIDECSVGTADCFSNSTCKNTIGSYLCLCNQDLGTFAWNESSCEDVDECAYGLQDCHQNAACSNSVGSYNCSCNPPLEGDGRTCGFTCQSPNKIIDGLGCIQVFKKQRTWQAMNNLCQRKGGRLLQDFKQHQLLDIQLAFGTYGWIGAKDQKWEENGSQINEDALWKTGYESDPSKLCGTFILDSSSFDFKMTQIECSAKRWGYCQYLV